MQYLIIRVRHSFEVYTKIKSVALLKSASKKIGNQ